MISEYPDEAVSYYQPVLRDVSTLSSNSNAKAHPCDGGQCVRFFSFHLNFWLTFSTNARRPARGSARPACSSKFLISLIHFSKARTGRKDGGIYALSFHQAEANGIHDGGCWPGGRRCRRRQDARHWLQGRFGECVSLTVMFCLAGRQKMNARQNTPLGGGDYVKICRHFEGIKLQHKHRPFHNIAFRYWAGRTRQISHTSQGFTYRHSYVLTARQKSPLHPTVEVM